MYVLQGHNISMQIGCADFSKSITKLHKYVIKQIFIQTSLHIRIRGSFNQSPRWPLNKMLNNANLWLATLGYGSYWII